MHPTICTIGPVTVYSYGLMLALAVTICTFFLAKDIKAINISSEQLYDFVFWTVLSGIIGARIFFILLNFSFFIEHPLEIIMVQKGGLAWQGSLILGTITALIFIKRRGWPREKFLDIAAPYLALGQAIGRVGCFLNGCCFGKHSDSGIYFPVHDDYLYPTQLYCSFGLFIVFIVLKILQKNNTFPGRIFILYLICASALRFGIEFFRADHTEIFFGLSIFQIICLFIITIALYAYTYLKSRRTKRQ